MDLKRPDGVLVVRGDKDDCGLMRLAQCGHHFEAIQAGHLNIEQHQIRGVLPDRLYGLLPIGAGGHHVGVRLGLKQPDQALPADRLIISHHYSQRHPTSSSRSFRVSGTGVCAASQAA